MSTTIHGKKKAQFPLPPQGQLLQMVCIDVWDIWTEPRREEWGGGLVDKTRLVWLVNKLDKQTGKLIEVSGLYTASLHKKATLRLHLEMWRGRPFTEAEILKFELENLIGVNGQLQVMHKPGSDGIIYANVVSLAPPQPGQVKMRIPEGYVRHRDRQAQQKAQERPSQPFGKPDDQPGEGWTPPPDPPDDEDVPFNVLLPVLGALPLLGALIA